MNRLKSIAAYQEASRYIPGGVNSPVRALRSVGETPLFVQNAKGSIITDVDGNRFTDYCMSWGVFILGHGHPHVLKAVKQAIGKGTSYGIPSLPETELAKAIVQRFPSIEQVRFVSSGTEAVMSAIRLARGFTERDVIVKFDGCYHGHADHLLVSAGSGVALLGKASSAGVPDSFTAHTVSIPFNDMEAVNKVFSQYGKNIAAVIVEPVPANMGVVVPQDGFLQHLRDVTRQYGSLLIFDEVITGLRLSEGGAQKRFGIAPDLTTLGKIIGGGFPAAAFGGRADIMALLAPDGPVYQAGTLSGNPVAMNAGIATLQILSQPETYEKMEKKAAFFYKCLSEVIYDKGITLNHYGSLFTLFFTKEKVNSFEDAQQCDRKRFAAFFRYMLSNHIYISPSQFEANFLSLKHKKKELELFVKIVKNFND
jgi:glutamate-1-semialdehyde 2,1-aminomutase